MTIFYLIALLLLGACAAFFAGLLGLGGGIWYVPGLDALFYHQGFTPDIVIHLALGTSTATIVFNALITTVRHQKHQAVRWPVVFYLVPGLIVGAFMGGSFAGHLPAKILALIFATFLLYMGFKFAFLKNGHFGTKPIKPILIACTSVVIGVLAAIMGLGGGVFLIPFLSRFELSMREVVAISAVCLLPQSFFASLGYVISGWGHPGLPDYATGFIYWPVIIPLVIMSLIFAPIGVSLVHRLPQQTIRRIFGLLLLGICFYMFYNALARY